MLKVITHRLKIIIPVVAVASILMAGLSGTVQATTITQGYQSNTPLSTGTVVSIGSQGSLEPATADNEPKLVGVVATGSSSIISIQPQGSNISVAVSGDAKVLVSNVDGNIKKGDYLIISPLAGIAMKDSVDAFTTKYIGIAEEDFSSTSPGAKSVTIQLSGGGSKQAEVGLITVNVLLSNRVPVQSQSSNPLVRLGEHIVGHKVSTSRVVFSAAILIAVLSITGWMLNASVKGSFISLGRNPLARTSILTNLLRVIAIALVIFAAGLTASYLFLSL